MFEKGYYLTNTENLKMILSYGIILEHTFYPKFYNDIQVSSNKIALARSKEGVQKQIHAARLDSENLQICMISKKNIGDDEDFFNLPVSLSEIDIFFKSKADIKKFSDSLDLYGDICIEGVSLKPMDAKQKRIIEEIENQSNDLLASEAEEFISIKTEPYDEVNNSNYEEALKVGALLSITHSLSKNCLNFAKFYNVLNQETEIRSILNFPRLVQHAEDCGFVFDDNEKRLLDSVLLNLFDTIKKANRPDRDLIATFLQTDTNFEKPSWANKAREIFFKITDIDETMSKSALLNTERSIFQTLCFTLLTKESWQEFLMDKTLTKEMTKNDLLLAGIFIGIYHGYNRIDTEIKGVKNLNVYISAKMCSLIKSIDDPKLPKMPKAIYDLIIPKVNDGKVKYLESNLKKVGFDSSDFDLLIDYVLPAKSRIIIENGSIKGSGIPKFILNIDEDALFDRMKLIPMTPSLINKF